MSGVDLTLHISNKLAGPWSASSVAPLLTRAVLAELTAGKIIDPLIRVRLLMAPLFLRRQDLAALRDALHPLAAAAAENNDEWTRVVAAAVGPYDGVVHTEAVKEHSSLVRATLEETKRHGAGADPRLFRPLEEKYLSTAVLEKRLPGLVAERNAVPEHAHFTLRDPAAAPGAAASAVPASVAAGASRPGSAGVSGGGVGARPASAGAAAKPLGAGVAAPGGRPPMGPPRPGSGAIGRRPEATSIFLSSRKPGTGGQGPLARAAAGSAAAGSRLAAKPKKKVMLLDLASVKQSNAKTTEELEKARAEAEAEREAAAAAKAEARRAEKEAEKERKRREAERAAAAVAAAKEQAKQEREEAKRKKEEEAARAKEAREAEKARREAEKERRAEDRAAKAAARVLKRGFSGSGGSSRGTKAARTGGDDTAVGALAAAQAFMDAAVEEEGGPGEPPRVAPLPAELAAEALREAEARGHAAEEGWTEEELREDDEEAREVARYLKMMEGGGGSGSDGGGGGGGGGEGAGEKKEEEGVKDAAAPAGGGDGNGDTAEEQI